LTWIKGAPPPPSRYLKKPGDITMKVSDIMSGKVVSVAADMPVADVAALLIECRLSAVPVVDTERRVLGIISEADLMRRPETGTERQSHWWLRLVTSPETLAADYIKSHGLAAKNVMTHAVATIDPDASLTLRAGAHDDTLIRQRLEETLAAEPWVSSRDVYVTALEHEAHLWGT
jgi:CBS-domain-containing membrane protein